MDCCNRPTFHDLRKRPALRDVEFGWLARRLAVNQAFRPFRIEPENPVTDHLKPDTPGPCRVRTPTTIVNLSQRKKPAALSRILRRLRQRPEKY